MADVDRPHRKARRANGKSDPVDAYAAATAVLSGRAHGRPKTRDGIVEAIRSLKVVRRSAIKSRTQTINQIHGAVSPGQSHAAKHLDPACGDPSCPVRSRSPHTFGTSDHCCRPKPPRPTAIRCQARRQALPPAAPLAGLGCCG
ncbi:MULTISPECIES: IS110 family transposase [unclassified Streptomyces]|uniref:IS110 family transposase n=1 Tax=unclassified Streptomyces TaxID=2593676 RepID=UPI0029AA097E|nr:MULTISPECIES: transposase [unclassified Streptomyces]MDX3767879.1 transposase [Streptomyces sp. AK08-01B]MDX3818106.1 transposase [Streptomyces sp. AK08-01A]